MSRAGAPLPGLRDHLAVAGLSVLVLASAVGAVLWTVLDVLRVPWLRRRARGRLAVATLPPEPQARVEGAAWAGRTVFVLAGETSGDRLAAPVVRALRALAPGVRVRGCAGPACAAAGLELDEDLTSRAVVGLLPVLRTLPTWWGACARFHARLRHEPPDLLVTVDFPGLNVRLARMARRRGIRCVHLVAPAVWAYAPWRARRWRRAVDEVLALYPHEPALLSGVGLPARYVGHPLFEAPLPAPRTPAHWPPAGPRVVELLPGSRRGEIERHVPVMVEAAARVAQGRDDLVFVMRLAAPHHRALAERALARARVRPARLALQVGAGTLPGPRVAALASSGTVTAELGAQLVPMGVVYGVSPMARAGAAWLRVAPWFALAHLVAGRAGVS
ncbi:MAG: hypothetical protein ACKOSS_00790, partial [Planctomycetia bacterium]